MGEKEAEKERGRSKRRVCSKRTEGLLTAP